jgi:hypothetical protein
MLYEHACIGLPGALIATPQEKQPVLFSPPLGASELCCHPKNKPEPRTNRESARALLEGTIDENILAQGRADFLGRESHLCCEGSEQ